MTGAEDFAPVNVQIEPGAVEAAVFKGVSKAYSPDVSVITTYTLPGNSNNPVPILPTDPMRFRATVINSGTTGIALIGSQRQVSQQLGGQIQVNGKLDIYSGKDYYAVAQGATAATLTVLIETFSQAESEAS